MVGCRRGHASIKVVGIYKELLLRDFLSVPIILTSNSTSLCLFLPRPGFLRSRETNNQ